MAEDEVKITKESLDSAYDSVLQDGTYGADLKLLQGYFKAHPENKQRDIVAAKVAMVDVTHSTHLSAHRKKICLPELADFILSISDFDERVAKGDLELVEILARNNGNVNLFSFASKYCQLHNSLIYGRDDYMKYDNVLKAHLPKYAQGVSSYRLDRLRQNIDYKEYMRIIDEILKDVNVKNKRMKLDYLIWYKNK